MPPSKDVAPEWAHSGRIPSLDGLRAVSILSVIFVHLAPQIPAPRWLCPFPGVLMFFALSGFLITLLMLREQEKSGAVGLGAFYLRRTLRIIPAYVAYLAVIGIATALGWTALDGRYWMAAIGYFMCYMPGLESHWDLGHAWTLSVEEHFYFLWPLLFNRIRKVMLGSFLIAWLLITPVIRFSVWSLKHPNLDIDFASVTQMSGIAVGCLLALVVTRRALPWVMNALCQYPEVALAAGALLLPVTTLLSGFGKFAILFGGPMASLCCAAILGGALFSRNWFIQGVLNCKGMVWIGQLSYSLYLWQQPFTAHGFGARWFPHWSLNLVVIFACAWVSFTYVETPFLRRKERLRVSVTASHPADAPVST